MDFLNKIGGSISNVSKEVTKKTKDLGGVVSLTSQIKDNQNNIDKLYKELGEKYYKEYNEEAAQRFAEEVKQVVVLQEKMEEDRRQLRALKGLKLCKSCGAEVENAALHCPMCGAELEVPVTKTVEETPSEQKFCVSCGEPLGTDAKFCGKCGAKTDL